MFLDVYKIHVLNYSHLYVFVSTMGVVLVSLSVSVGEGFKGTLEGGLDKMRGLEVLDIG